MKAIVLSIFVPGLGQLAQGRLLSGVCFFVLGGLLYMAGCGLFGNLLAAVHAAWEPSPRKAVPPAAQATVAPAAPVAFVAPGASSVCADSVAPVAPVAAAAALPVSTGAGVTLNLTQHAATPEQIAAGVVDLQGTGATTLRHLLTFKHIPERDDVLAAAEAIAALAKAHGAQAAMIGGAPFLMGPLEIELKLVGIKPVYAFSRRESVEEAMPNGSVRKTAILRHAGFVSA